MPLTSLERAARGRGRSVRRRRGAGEHRVDRVRDELDVPELLGGDVRDEVVERPRALLVAEVERLERVVQEHGHAQGRRDAHRTERHLDEQPDRVPVPVAALRDGWRGLRKRCRSGREDLPPVVGRRRPDDPRSRPGRERRRRRGRAIGTDGRRRGKRRSPEHRPSVDLGEERVGQELTAEEGSWTNTPTGYAYQWQRCDADGTNCLPVVGANGKTYGVRTADVGFALRVRVTARNASGSGSANSALSAVVAPAVTVTDKRPTLRIVSVRFLGARVYARFGSATTPGRT